MQRVWAILLALAFSFSLIAPALAAENRTRVPSCCRKDGKHRCAMSDAGTTVLDTFSVAPPAGVQISLIAAHPQGVPQTEARQRLAFSRSAHKRGPPTC
ncbi:MAG: hypothetical protein NTV70_22295 [Acidobacteria bacterium]|nr:hypothetical protein [Acidobacteriota bacterium]